MESRKGWLEWIERILAIVRENPGARVALVVMILGCAALAARAVYRESRIGDILDGRADAEEVCRGPRVPGGVLQEADERALASADLFVAVALADESGNHAGNLDVPLFRIKACLSIAKNKFVEQEQARFQTHIGRATAETLRTVEQAMPRYLEAYYDTWDNLWTDFKDFALGMIRPIQQIAHDVAHDASGAEVLWNAACAAVSGSSEASQSREEKLLTGLVGVPVTALRESAAAYYYGHRRIGSDAALIWDETSSALVGTKAKTKLTMPIDEGGILMQHDEAAAGALGAISAQPNDRDMYKELISNVIEPVFALRGAAGASRLVRGLATIGAFALTSVLTTWISSAFGKEERGRETLAQLRIAMDKWSIQVSADHKAKVEQLAERMERIYINAASRQQLHFIRVAGDAVTDTSTPTRCPAPKPWDGLITAVAKPRPGSEFCRKPGTRTGYYLRVSSATTQSSAMATVNEAWHMIVSDHVAEHECPSASVMVFVNRNGTVGTGILFDRRPSWWNEVVARRRDWLVLGRDKQRMAGPVCLFPEPARCSRLHGWTCSQH